MLLQFSCSFEAFWTVLVLFMQYPYLHDNKHKNTISLEIIVSFLSFLGFSLDKLLPRLRLFDAFPSLVLVLGFLVDFVAIYAISFPARS